MTKGKISLAALAAFACVCCAGAKASERQTGSVADTADDGLLLSQEKEGLIVVGVSQIGSESDWRIAASQSIKDSFTTENGFYLVYKDGQQKQENQIKALRNFILQDVDYIVLDPIVETGWDATLQKAKEAGIPVILIDRMADVDENLYTCWVGSDFREEGCRAAQWLAADLESRGFEDETVNIVTLQGTIGSSAELGRTEGFAEEMEKHDNWNMLAMESGEFTQAKGEEVMTKLLMQYDDIDVLVSQNDNMTFGAIDAIRKAGKTCGPDGDITILSFDAVAASFDAMEAGEINADFECNPLNGPRVLAIIRDLEAGKTVDKIQYLDETYFDTTMDLETIRETRMY